VNPQPIPDDEYEQERPSFWTRIKNGLLGTEDPEDDEVDTPAVLPDAGTQNRRQSTPLRLQTSRSGRVAIRLNAQVFEDAKMAADGLKGGEHQIVNLERATPQMGERIIDFLNGVCYALDGTVERVGEKVYMFVPANVPVEVDNGALAANNATATSANRRAMAFSDGRE
jgi:cell division inhibitor SepF